MIFWIKIARRSFFRFFTGFTDQRELFAAQFLARRTHDCSMMKPVVFKNSDVDLLSGMETFKCVVRNMNMKSAVVARISVAAASPMLPLASLMARSLFPHLFRMLEAFRLWAVLFQGKVFLMVWIVFLKFTLRTPNDDVLASPSKLLDVRAVISCLNERKKKQLSVQLHF